MLSVRRRTYFSQNSRLGEFPPAATATALDEGGDVAFKVALKQCCSVADTFPTVPFPEVGAVALMHRCVATSVLFRNVPFEPPSSTPIVGFSGNEQLAVFHQLPQFFHGTTLANDLNMKYKHHAMITL